MALRELDSAPGRVSLYPRALAGATLLPALRRVPGLGGALGRTGELPDTELALRDVEVSPDHLAAYDRVCGFRLRDDLPATYPHLLAFPLGMELMTAPAFPFGVLGLVHVRNEITVQRPIALGERLDVRVRTADLRPHDRGTQFDVVAEVAAEGERVWQGRSAYLHREGGGGSKERGGERPAAPEANAVWQVPGDIGRRYAAVSGDSNPIHLHPLAAKAFGMRRAIAHGMWAKARCLAALEADLPRAFTVAVAFKLPVELPARVGFSASADGRRRAFALHDARSGKPHLDGIVTPTTR